KTAIVTPSNECVPALISTAKGSSRVNDATSNRLVTYRQRLRRYTSTLGEHRGPDENALFGRIEFGRVRGDDRTIRLARSDAKKASRHTFHVMREVFTGQVQKAERNNVVGTEDRRRRRACPGSGDGRV